MTGTKRLKSFIADQNGPPRPVFPVLGAGVLLLDPGPLDLAALDTFEAPAESRAIEVQVQHDLAASVGRGDGNQHRVLDDLQGRNHERPLPTVGGEGALVLAGSPPDNQAPRTRPAAAEGDLDIEHAGGVDVASGSRWSRCRGSTCVSRGLRVK